MHLCCLLLFIMNSKACLWLARGVTRAHLNGTVPLTDEARVPLGRALGGPLVGVCAAATPEHSRGLSKRQLGRETLTAMKGEESEGTADCVGLKGLSSDTTLYVLSYLNIQYCVHRQSTDYLPPVQSTYKSNKISHRHTKCEPNYLTQNDKTYL